VREDMSSVREDMSSVREDKGACTWRVHLMEFAMHALVGCIVVWRNDY